MGYRRTPTIYFIICPRVYTLHQSTKLRHRQGEWLVQRVLAETYEASEKQRMNARLGQEGVKVICGH